MNNGNNTAKFDKISSQLDLIEELKKYRSVINNWMLDYLTSLIRLEFSVVREYISKEEREVLSELEIYKKISMYNIYHRAQRLLENSEIKFEIWNNKQQFHGLIAERELSDGRNVIPFNYKYTMKYGIDELPNSCIKSMYIGEINLCYLTVSEKTYEYLTKRADSYIAKTMNDPVDKNLKNLAPILKQEVTMINEVYNRFLKDYSLKEDDFKKSEKSNLENATNLEKKFVKKIPNLVINSFNKHIDA